MKNQTTFGANSIERLFSHDLLKVLVCTATLVWGVNLPAHTVIIKGTQLYDPKAGGWKDLGILDVMQIFGCAGRPQFDKSGEGIIITTHDKLVFYLRLLTSQLPIESQFITSMKDNLNAEVALGTVTNVKEKERFLTAAANNSFDGQAAEIGDDSRVIKDAQRPDKAGDEPELSLGVGDNSIDIVRTSDYNAREVVGEVVTSIDVQHETEGSSPPPKDDSQPPEQQPMVEYVQATDKEFTEKQTVLEDVNFDRSNESKHIDTRFHFIRECVERG